MRKLIVLIFIIGFVGSAGAAEVTYHFTAEIYAHSDEQTGIFSELGYSYDLPLKGKITIDTETEPMLGDLTYPHLPGAYGLWETGAIMFQNQGYTWLDTCTRKLMIMNLSSGHRMMQMWTKQFRLDANPEVTEVLQTITLTNDGLDASMPENLNLGINPEYTVQIKKGGLFSVFKARITSIKKAEADSKSDEASIDRACPVDAEWKNHGAYVNCVAQYEEIMSGKDKGAIVSRAAKSEHGKKK